MKLFNKFVLLFTFAATATLFTGASQARIKCWTNSDGVRECGDKVPPEYAQKGHKELSGGGTIVEEYQRAQTPEEIAEARRLTALIKQEEKDAAEAARKDMILLDTFAATEDIEMVRDSKLDALESSIKLTNKRNEKIQADYDALLEKAATQERAGKTPSDDMLNDIDSLGRQFKNNKAFIAEKRKKQEDVKKATDKDIARFNELKSAGR